jgi:hypothetical protein
MVTTSHLEGQSSNLTTRKGPQEDQIMEEGADPVWEDDGGTDDTLPHPYHLLSFLSTLLASVR